MNIKEIVHECCAKLGEKVHLLNRFAVVTQNIKDGIRSKEIEKIVLHVEERQRVVNKIQSVDRQLNTLFKAGEFSTEKLSQKAKNKIDNYLDQIKKTLVKLVAMDGECLELALAEHTAMQAEIFQAKSSLQAVRGYGRTHNRTPRFLDLKR